MQLVRAPRAGTKPDRSAPASARPGGHLHSHFRGGWKSMAYRVHRRNHVSRVNSASGWVPPDCTATE